MQAKNEMNWTKPNIKSPCRHITPERCRAVFLRGCSEEQIAFYHLQIIQNNLNSQKNRQLVEEFEIAVCNQHLPYEIFHRYECGFPYSLEYIKSYVYHYCQLYLKYKEIQSTLAFDQFVDVIKSDNLHYNRLGHYSMLIMNTVRNKSLRNNLTLLYKPRAINPPYSVTSKSLAQEFYKTKDVTLCPILADSLMDEGYEDELILDTLNNNPKYISRGSWIIQKLLYKI
jgi:hypothetical protein